MEDDKINLLKALREERLRGLDSLSGLVVPKDELRDRRREIVREFSQGGGI